MKLKVVFLLIFMSLSASSLEYDFTKFKELAKTENGLITLYSKMMELEANSCQSNGQQDIAQNVKNRVERIREALYRGVLSFYSYHDVFDTYHRGDIFFTLISDGKYVHKQYPRSQLNRIIRGAVKKDPIVFGLKPTANVVSISWNILANGGVDYANELDNQMSGKIMEVVEALNDLEDIKNGFSSKVYRLFNALMSNVNYGNYYNHLTERRERESEVILFGQAYREFITFKNFLNVLNQMGIDYKNQR